MKPELKSVSPKLADIAAQVKDLHERDEALAKTRVKTKVEQREVRFKIGELVADLSDDQVAVVAERSGYTSARLGNFAFVYKQWPAGTFPEDASYTPLEELARDPERFSKIKSGMSKRDARAARGGKVDTPSRWTPQVKADFIKEALADPDVVRQVAADVSSRAAIARAEQDIYREERDQRDLDPRAKASRKQVAGDDVIRRITNARYLVTQALDRVLDDELTPAKRKEAQEALGELATSISWFQAHLESGDTSFEEQLEALLSQEN